MMGAHTPAEKIAANTQIDGALARLLWSSKTIPI